MTITKPTEPQTRAVAAALAAGYNRRMARSGTTTTAGECVRIGCQEPVDATAPAFCERCRVEELEIVRPLLEGVAKLNSEDQARVMALAVALVDAAQEMVNRAASLLEEWAQVDAEINALEKQIGIREAS